MKYIYILDWLINKPIKIKGDFKVGDFKYGDKIVYSEKDKPQENKLIGTYIGYECDTFKEGEFIEKLGGYKEKKFQDLQKQAYDIFVKSFRKEFKSRFPTSVPITARMNFGGDIAYFYFYAEERFEFGTFLSDFRKIINKKFFLFQVGARDRIRMSPETDNIYGPCGHGLCCKKDSTPLPSVENMNIELQDLYYKGIEKLKGRCGKLKCCLNYEKDLYAEESSKYPRKGDEFKHGGCKVQCCSINIMTGDIIAKDVEKGEMVRLNINDFPDGKYQHGKSIEK